jgi:hypothetical protein
MSTLEFHQLSSGGHMVAVMALMESPAIVVGVALLTYYGGEPKNKMPMGSVVKHALTNGSVLLILGSLLIGFVADERQAEGIKPFTTDIFKGFLALFLLEMGMVTARRFSAFKQYGVDDSFWYCYSSFERQRRGLDESVGYIGCRQSICLFSSDG